jgi:Spy/CpxP family protein refolding chaperone
MRELTLNDDQSSAMRAILDRTRDDYKAVCADVRPRYDVVRDKARNQMRVLLTPDQQQRFDSIVTAQDCRCPEPKK